MEEFFKRLNVYDDIAVYAPGLLVALALMPLTRELFKGVNEHIVVIGFLVLGFPIGLLVQALASITVEPLIGTSNKKDALSRLSSRDATLLKTTLGPDLGPEALFTRCVTQFDGDLDSYVKFKALADICRSLSFLHASMGLLPLLFFSPAVQRYSSSTWIQKLSTNEHRVLLVGFVVFCCLAAFALARRSKHFSKIASDIVFDIAIVKISPRVKTTEMMEAK